MLLFFICYHEPRRNVSPFPIDRRRRQVAPIETDWKLLDSKRAVQAAILRPACVIMAS